MVSISNADRDKIATILRNYVALLQQAGVRTAKQMNARREAFNLARKLKRKPTHVAGR